MNVMIFDTETISVDKPFCYNIGYVIADSENMEIVLKKDFVVEQVWHNPMLFSTAYYANKREIYVSAMRSKKTIMNKFGYICQEMIRDIRALNVEIAFAYNSKFDKKVFNFNCEWFHCNNPFDNIPVHDIRGFAHTFICDDNFMLWAETHEKFTESGNYSTTAETLFGFISNNEEFIEEHTALSDSLIETEILFYAVNTFNADITCEYPIKNSIPRRELKILTVQTADGRKFDFECYGYTVYKSKDLVKLK